MKVVVVILTGLVFLSCRKEKKAAVDPKDQAKKFQAIVGKYLVQDSIVTRDPGVVYTQVTGRGKGSDQRFRADGRVEIYTSTTTQLMMNYEFKSPDTLFVWDLATDRHHNWYSTVSIPRSNYLIMRQQVQQRVIEFHYTAE